MLLLCFTWHGNYFTVIFQAIYTKIGFDVYENNFFKLFFQAIYTTICFVYIALWLFQKIPILNLWCSLPRNFSLWARFGLITKIFGGFGVESRFWVVVEVSVRQGPLKWVFGLGPDQCGSVQTRKKMQMQFEKMLIEKKKNKKQNLRTTDIGFSSVKRRRSSKGLDEWHT